jgi:MOSC domain
VVEQIVIRELAGGAPIVPERAAIDAGRGLRGDRYWSQTGTWSDGDPSGRALTLIDAAVLDSLGLTGEQSYRNVVTHGIDLDALVGRRLRIGAVECFGARDCPPCLLLERRTRPGVLRALARCGGLRVDVLTDGEIAVGDAVVVVE